MPGIGEPEPAAGPPAVVTLAEGPGATRETHVRLESFDGPLALLLSLIESRRLDIFTVPLGALAAAFLEALETVEVGRLGSISAFVAVAGQLILIKSRALLPRPPAAPTVEDGELIDPEEDLRARLIEYQRFRTAAAGLAGIGTGWRISFRRETPARVQQLEEAASTAPRTDPAQLVAALDRLSLVVPRSADPITLVSRAITLSERTEIIRAALEQADLVVLQDLLHGVRDRVVVAVTFLALLELVKRREVTIDQAEPWGPIVVRPRSPDVAPE